jgi:flagellar hook-associated protein FlgK
MIQEQQSYEAAAKLITTEQSVISSLLSAVS